MKETLDHGPKLTLILAELSPERREDLIHLLTCEWCHKSARESLEAETEVGPPKDRPPAAGYGPILEAVEARVPALVKQMEEQGAEARRLLDRLLAHPAERQITLAGSPAFGSLDLADLLLRESAGAQPEDPVRAEGLARLALPIVYQSHPRKCADRVTDLKARAAVLLGNARRLQRDLPEADERFRHAAFHLTGPPDDPGRALYCQMLAALRRDQHRDDEAAGLLWRAASLYRVNGDLLEEGACLAELGFLFLAGDQAHEAMFPLARAVPMLDLHRDVRLGLRARQALAVCYARTGRGEKARALIVATRPLYSRITDSAQMAETVWMEGKVTLLTGDREDAAALLDTARKSFLSAGNLFDAALASLDLVPALSGKQRVERVHSLVHQIAERFATDPNLLEPLRALGAVEMAVAGHVSPLEDVVALAAERLRRVRRYPQVLVASPARRPDPDRSPAPSPSDVETPFLEA